MAKYHFCQSISKSNPNTYPSRSFLFPHPKVKFVNILMKYDINIKCISLIWLQYFGMLLVITQIMRSVEIDIIKKSNKLKTNVFHQLENTKRGKIFKIILFKLFIYLFSLLINYFLFNTRNIIEMSYIPRYHVWS